VEIDLGADKREPEDKRDPAEPPSRDAVEGTGSVEAAGP
jgi:hypothetical protein